MMGVSNMDKHRYIVLIILLLEQLKEVDLELIYSIVVEMANQEEA